MDKKLLAVTAIAVTALIVASISLGFAFSVLNNNQPNSPAQSQTPSPTSNPSTGSTYTSSQSPTGNQPTGYPPEFFSLNYTVGSWNSDGNPSPSGDVPTKMVSNGEQNFNIRISNPEPNQASPQRCFIRLTVTALDQGSIQPSTAYLGINTQGWDLYGAPAVMYSRYTQINASASGNTLTFLFAPDGGYWRPYIEYLSPNGFSIPAGFDEEFSMKLDLKAAGSCQVAVDLVPAT